MKSDNEKIFDALIDVAANQAFQEEMQLLPSCEEMNEMYTPSAELNNKIHKMIKRRQSNIRFKRAMRAATRIAASLGIVLVVFTAVIFSVEASRNFVINTLIQWQSDHASFNFENSKDDTFNFKGYSPEYIPSGFERVSLNSSDASCLAVYQNQDGEQITIRLTLAESSDISIDTDNTDYSEITVNQDKAYLFKAKAKGDVSVIIWQHDGIAFKVNSAIDYSEILRIAENISKK